MNAIEISDQIKGLNLSKREEKVLRKLVIGASFPRNKPRYDIPLVGVKGAMVTTMVIIAGFLLGYLLFLVTPKWKDYLISFLPLWIYFLGITAIFKLPVRENLVRKLYRTLEGGSMSNRSAVSCPEPREDTGRGEGHEA